VRIRRPPDIGALTEFCVRNTVHQALAFGKTQVTDRAGTSQWRCPGFRHTGPEFDPGVPVPEQAGARLVSDVTADVGI
jgi:hypothetical protein